MIGNVWIHTGPAPETPRVGVIVPIGQPVELGAAANGWLLVAWGDGGQRYSGWVPERYVQAAAPVPTATPPGGP
jgi:hypothetical protein